MPSSVYEGCELASVAVAQSVVIDGLGRLATELATTDTPVRVLASRVTETEVHVATCPPAQVLVSPCLLDPAISWHPSSFLVTRMTDIYAVQVCRRARLCAAPVVLVLRSFAHAGIRVTPAIRFDTRSI